MSVTASILIRAKNEAKDIAKTLALIADQSVLTRDVVVVDSGSTDGTVELVQQWSAQQANQLGLTVTLLHMPAAEFTFGRSLNLGMAAAQGDVVLNLSAHACPCDRDWLNHLIQPFENPQVAGVYGKQVPHPDAYPVVARDYLSFYGNEARVQTNGHDPGDHAFSNANAAVRRSCWETRSFDERLSGCEDVEWARAMLGLGYQIVYAPGAAVYHSHNEPLLKVYQRTYREALAQKALYHSDVGIKGALHSWYSTVLADLRFMRQHQQAPRWFVQAPIYRLFWAYGYLRPDLPAALWRPLTKLTKLKRPTKANDVSEVTSQ